MDNTKKVEWVLRIAIFGTFLGHGTFALLGKKSWIPYLTTVGFSEGTAAILLPVIGVIDIVVALFMLIKPLRAVLIWAAVWGFATALIRPVSGEPVWDFIERASNWGAPLALLLLRGIPRRVKEFFS